MIGNISTDLIDLTAINSALIPSITNAYDIGTDALRWKNGYFSGVMTVYDLIVESGSSIKLAGATFENQGHYTSVDTNWMVKHDDQPTAFIGVYAENTGVMTHANLVLDAQGATLNLLKNSPIHPWAPNAGGIVNDAGNFGIFVDHSSEISWQHFTELTKDQYGNITNMTGMQSLMRLTDDFLLLEDVGLKVNDILIVNDAGVLQETDPVFSAWDKSTGIVITESQISDLDHFTTDDEIDPLFTAWDKSTGILITESQISDLEHFDNADETDPIFAAWDKSTGIEIFGSQLKNLTDGKIAFASGFGGLGEDNLFEWDYVNHRLGVNKVNPTSTVDVNGTVKATGMKVNNVNVLTAETDPVFTAWEDSLAQGSVPFKDVGGLIGSNNFTYNGSSLSIGNGGIFLDRTGNDSFISFSKDGVGQGQLRGGGGKIYIGDPSGSPVFLTVDTTTGITSMDSVDTPKIYNSAGLFKIQPDAQGDVELFGDTDVANNENSKIFKMWRRAPEGNDYIRFYISQTRNAYIHASNKLTLQAQVPFTINSVTDDIIFKVGDNAGVKKFYFRDSDGNTVAKIDSNGILNIDANTGGYLNLTRGTVNKISNVFDSTYTDLRFAGEKDYNRIGTWIDKPFQIVTDSINRIIIDQYGRVEMTNSLTVDSDITVMDDILAYGDVAARNHVVRRAVVFEDNSTQIEAGERHSSHGHTHTAIYNGDWYDADAEGASQRDMHFSPDGLMMYIIGLSSGGAGDCCIWEYPLTTPWDLSTVGTPTIENIETYGSNQVGLFIDIDGRKLWTVCTANDTVIEYSMNPWNISSLSWVQAKDISGQDSSPSAVFWSANGDRLFIAGDGDNDIVAFSIVNEWDIGGLSWFQDFGTDIDAPTGLHFSSDGRRMYVMDGSAEDDIHEFHLSDPWMIESARLVNLFNVSAENSSPQGIFITPDNSKIFMVGTSTPDGVYSYDLGLEVKGNIISGTFKAENMPASDPVHAGKFWNDGGNVRISAG